MTNTNYKTDVTKYSDLKLLINGKNYLKESSFRGAFIEERINSPFLLMKNCTLGSDLFNFISPFLRFSMSSTADSIVTFTNPIEIVWSLMKFGQSSVLLMVPVLIKRSSRPPIPTIDPAGA